MIAKKGLFLLLPGLLLCYNLCFAGELISREAENYYNEGVRAQKIADFMTADVSYQKVLFLDPHNPQWKKFILNNEGAMAAASGDYEQAEQAFKKAIEIDRYYKPALFNLGLLYEKTKSRVEALEYWVRAFDIDRLKPKDYVIQEIEPGNQDNN